MRIDINLLARPAPGKGDTATSAGRKQVKKEQNSDAKEYPTAHFLPVHGLSEIARAGLKSERLLIEPVGFVNQQFDFLSTL